MPYGGRRPLIKLNSQQVHVLSLYFNVCEREKGEAVRLLRSAAPSCLTLWDPTDCSPPGSSVHGVLWARILDWGASPHLSCLLHWQPGSLPPAPRGSPSVCVTPQLQCGVMQDTRKPLSKPVQFQVKFIWKLM